MNEDKFKSNSESGRKVLALQDGTASDAAYCISSYGAFQAVCMLSPSGIKEVFCNTPPSELEEIAEMIEDTLQDYYPEDREGEIKDLAFKKQVVLKLAEDNSKKDAIVKENKKFDNTS